MPLLSRNRWETQRRTTRREGRKSCVKGQTTAVPSSMLRFIPREVGIGGQLKGEECAKILDTQIQVASGHCCLETGGAQRMG